MSSVVLTPLKIDYPSIVPQEGSVVTIGRSESCDFTINNQFLSFVHASLITKNNEIYITDLDSTNGVFLNEKPVKAEKIKEGDIVRFGSVRYKVELEKSQFNEKSEASRILKDTSFLKAITSHEEEDKGLPKAPSGYTKDTTEATSVIDAGSLRELRAKKERTLVDIFPQFEFSEFIFEENIEGESLDFKQRQPSVELSVLFGSFIYGVYYFNHDQRQLTITNQYKKGTPYTFPIVGMEKNIRLLDSTGKVDFNIHENSFFNYKVFNESGVIENPFSYDGTYVIKKDDVVLLSKDSLNIYLRLTDSPPRTKKVGFFDRDKFLFWLVLFSLFVWLGISALLFMYEPPAKEKDPEKISQKIDRILYKKKEKPLPRKEPKVEEAKEVSEKNDIIDEKVKTSEEIKAQNESSSLSKGAPVVQPQEKKEVKAPEPPKSKKPEPQIVPPPPAAASKKNSESEVTEFKEVSEKVVRTSETAKAQEAPANNIKKLTNKFSKYLDNIQSNSSGKTNQTSQRKNITQTGSSTGTKDIGFIRNKKVKTGSLQGNQIGDLGSQKITTGGVGNLVGFSHSLGQKTVILGALDPRDIQNALREHLPRFSYCYERELERINRRISTTLALKFTITPDGGVTKYSFTAKNATFSSQAIKCFAKVLTSIRFPKPKGGGIVKVNQPISMEPRY